MNSIKKKETIAYILAFISVILTSFIGSFYSSKSVKSKWYTCIKPSITPPNYVFPIVWTLLYIMIGICFAREIINQNKTNITLFVVNLVLNILWCYLYFDKKNILYSFITVIMITLTSLIIIIRTRDSLVRYLLIPYLLWTSFASLKTVLILILNHID